MWDSYIFGLFWNYCYDSFCFLFPSLDCHLWDNWDQLSTLFFGVSFVHNTFFLTFNPTFQSLALYSVNCPDWKKIGLPYKKALTFSVNNCFFFSTFFTENLFAVPIWINAWDANKTFAKTVWFLIRHRQWSSSRCENDSNSWNCEKIRTEQVLFDRDGER